MDDLALAISPSTGSIDVRNSLFTHRISSKRPHKMSHCHSLILRFGIYSPGPRQRSKLSRWLVAVGLFLIVAVSWSVQAADVLSEADQLAKELRGGGWTYKFRGQASKKETDCTQFLLEVLQRSLNRSFDGPVRTAVNISDVSEPEIALLLQRSDPRLDGAVHALCDLLHVADRVQIEEVRPGDVIQYWMKRQDGSWFGHCGVIESVNQSYAYILGAHQTAGPDGNIGRSLKAINLRGDERKIAIARLSP